MLTNEVITNAVSPLERSVILDECSDFLESSHYIPLYKNLGGADDDFRKVKARYRKKPNKITEAFNIAFNNKLPNLHAKAVFASGKIIESDASQDPFYIFPIDGFKFMYSETSTITANDNHSSFCKIFEEFDRKDADVLLSELLKYSYVSEDLVEGVKKGSEIIIYNIPFYYAIRATVPYEDLLTSL